MARKIIFEEEHLRRIGNEGEANWESRQLICDAYLEAREEWPRCGYRLYQQKMAEGTNQIPDFILTCKGGKQWAIEIGLTGSERVANLEHAGFNVVKVRRGYGVDFAQKFTCGNCPYSE